MSDRVTDILTDNAETFEKKQEDYGDSWRKIGEILLMLTEGEGVTLETKEDFVAFGLFTRRLDKFARAFHGEFVADDLEFESLIDAHEDESVYAAMSAVNAMEREDERCIAHDGDMGMRHPTVEVDERGQ